MSGVPLGAQDYSADRPYRPPTRTYARLNRWVGVPLARWGWVPGDVVSLEVPGRRSGRVRAVPVVVTRHAGREYLVALAGESQWVRNVRAARGRAVLRRRHRARPVRLEELPTPERPPVIAAYLEQGRRRGGAATEESQARSYFGLEPGASAGDIAEVADRYPVFLVRDPG